jgi:hypothetical protein
VKSTGLFFILLLIASSAQADDLSSFSQGLNKTLHRLNASTKACDSKPQYNTSKTASHTTTKFGKITVSVMSEAEAQKLFKDMQSHTEIPFNFPQGGCVERAHEMSRLMLLKGITPMKAFVEAGDGAELVVPHPTKAGRKISWNSHVAPAVLVEKDGKLVPYIIDPSIQSQAVPVEQWKTTMIPDTRYSKAKLIYGSATTLISTGFQIDYKDEATNASNKQELDRLKKLAADPDGENIYLDEIEAQRMKMEPPAY